MTDLLEAAGTATEFRRLAAGGALDLPLPASGRTWNRWDALARLAEGHTGAVGILAEAGHAAVPGALYGEGYSHLESRAEFGVLT